MSTWALVGSPNSGKTTLYNWLTGSRSKAVNYPGATVEYSLGTLRSGLAEKWNNLDLKIVDTPGVYSLTPQSEDEWVTYKTLFSKNQSLTIDGVIVVVDATQLNRHLVLVRQLLKTGYPLLVVVTMADVIAKQKAALNLDVLSEALGVPAIAFDGVLGKGLDQLIQSLQKIISSQTTFSLQTPPVWTLSEQETQLIQVQKIADKVIQNFHQQEGAVRDHSFLLDRFLLHPFFGFVFFFIFMTLLFASVYWLAKPIMDQIDQLFSFLSDHTTQLIPGLWGNFLGDGLLSAIGGVLIFIPQIFILFLGIGFLESSGYLARAAVLVDKPLSWIGLGGRSFVPILSGFACAIPALMATRNITSRKEKFLAQMIIPLMTCSARLPVYGLMIGFLYSDQQPLMAGMVMALLYFGALFVGAVASRLISILVLRSHQQSRLMMELPPYRRPRFRALLIQALTKAKSFSLRAGPIILILALVLWFGTHFPRPENMSEVSKSEVATHSYAAQFGQAIEPVFKPLGVDWRVGFGLISAFAAREVFVSTLALVFNVEGDEDQQTQGLLTAMREAHFPDGSKIFTTASVVGILIFFMIALQCISTVGMIKKETGSWKIAFSQLVISNGVAYVLAFIVVNTLKFFGY